MKKPILIILLLAFAKFVSAQQTADSTKTQNVYTLVERGPTFAGPGTISDFMIRNIHYPEYSFKNHVEGKVLVNFKITTDGQVSEIKVTQPISAELDSEAVRVVRLTKWHPAIQNSRPLACYLTIPFDFRLANSTPSN
jgi:periplasmic protein TonB